MKVQNKRIVNIFFGLFVLTTFAFSQPVNYERNLLQDNFPPEKLKEIILTSENWKPYPAYANRNAWLSLPEVIKNHFSEKGDEWLSYEWPSLTAERYLDFSRDGNRSRFEHIYFERRTVLGDLVIAELVEGKGRYIGQIINGTWLICEESSWCVPAHIALQTEYTPLPSPNEDVVDLFAAETSTLLSYVYYFFKDSFDLVTPVINQRIKKEIDNRVLKPCMQRDDFWWMGFGERKNVNNWNPWIISNWLITTLIMEENNDQRTQSLYKAMLALDNFMNIYPNDGGCDEGPGYWGHAGGALFNCLETLYLASGKQIDLWNEQLIKNIGNYIYKVHIDQNYYINFADASAKNNINEQVVYNYGNRIHDELMKKLAVYQFHMRSADHYLSSRWFARKLSAIFTYEDLSKQNANAPLIGDFWLPDIQVFGARTEAGSIKGFYIAAKGGHNNESHNHNDVGNFMVYYNGNPVLIDAGVGEYTRKTFSKERYTIWTMQSQYHNLPTINGFMQKDGYEFKAADVNYQNKGSKVYFKLDIANAYPDTAGIISWIRNICFNRKKGINITETYSLSQYIEPQKINFLTSCNVGIKENKIILTAGDIDQNNRFIIELDKPGDYLIDTELINLDDKKLYSCWGNSLTRIIVKSKNTGLTGKISYTIKYAE